MWWRMDHCVLVVLKLATNFVSSKLNHLSFRKWIFPHNPGGDSKLWKLLQVKGSINYQHHVDVCGPCQNKPRFPRQPRLNQTKIRQTENTNMREDDRTGSLTWDGRQHHVPWPLNFVKLAENDVQPGQGHKIKQMSPQFCHPEIHSHVLGRLLRNFTGINHKLGYRAAALSTLLRRSLSKPAL